MNTIEQALTSVFKKDKYDRDLYGIGVIVGMTIKEFIEKDKEGFTKSDFLKGINTGLSKDPENIETA